MLQHYRLLHLKYSAAQQCPLLNHLRPIPDDAEQSSEHQCMPLPGMDIV